MIPIHQIDVQTESAVASNSLFLLAPLIICHVIDKNRCCVSAVFFEQSKLFPQFRKMLVSHSQQVSLCESLLPSAGQTQTYRPEEKMPEI